MSDPICKVCGQRKNRDSPILRLEEVVVQIKRLKQYLDEMFSNEEFDTVNDYVRSRFGFSFNLVPLREEQDNEGDEP